MTRKKKKTSFWDLKQGCKNVGGVLVQATKEVSSIPAYGMRELTGQPHRSKPTCSLKKGWFE